MPAQGNRLIDQILGLVRLEPELLELLIKPSYLVILARQGLLKLPLKQRLLAIRHPESGQPIIAEQPAQQLVVELKLEPFQ